MSAWELRKAAVRDKVGGLFYLTGKLWRMLQIYSSWCKLSQLLQVHVIVVFLFFICKQWGKKSGISICRFPCAEWFLKKLKLLVYPCVCPSDCGCLSIWLRGCLSIPVNLSWSKVVFVWAIWLGGYMFISWYNFYFWTLESFVLKSWLLILVVVSFSIDSENTLLQYHLQWESLYWASALW